MTPQFLARQNKITLFFLVVFIVVLALMVWWFAKPEGRMADASAANAESRMFIGLNRVPPAKLQALLPESAGQPTLISFHSRLCHDCRRMAPVIAEMLPRYPGLYFRKFDILEDKKSAAAVFDAFRPVSVPVLVFVDANGRIDNVLYNYQSPEVIGEALASINASET